MAHTRRGGPRRRIVPPPSAAKAGIRKADGSSGMRVSARGKGQLEKAARLYGEDSTATDPAEILLMEIRRTAGHIEWLRAQIEFADPKTFVHSLWLVRRQSGYINPKEIDMTAFSDAGALWVDLYLQERRHLAAICRTALAAGIEERRVRLAERQAENLGRAVKGMLYDLGLDPEDEHVRAVVFQWLTAASTGDVEDATKRPTLLPIEGGKE